MFTQGRSARLTLVVATVLSASICLAEVNKVSTKGYSQTASFVTLTTRATFSVSQYIQRADGKQSGVVASINGVVITSPISYSYFNGYSITPIGTVTAANPSAKNAPGSATYQFPGVMVTYEVNPITGNYEFVSREDITISAEATLFNPESVDMTRIRYRETYFDGHYNYSYTSMSSEHGRFGYRPSGTGSITLTNGFGTLVAVPPGTNIDPEDSRYGYNMIGYWSVEKA